MSPAPMFPDYLVKRARNWIRMGWTRDGLAREFGGTAAYFAKLTTTEAERELQRAACVMDCSTTEGLIRALDLHEAAEHSKRLRGWDLLAEVVGPVAPLSARARAARERARVERCENAEARAFERNAYGR